MAERLFCLNTGLRFVDVEDLKYIHIKNNRIEKRQSKKERSYAPFHLEIKSCFLPDIDTYTLSRHGVFIGVSDFLLPIEDIESRFETLAQQTKNALIVQVLDPAEIELGFSGRVHFTGIDTEDEEIINNVANIRESYAQRIAEHIKAMESLCLRYGWHYQLHRTDYDITDTLRTIWESVEKGGLRK